MSNQGQNQKLDGNNYHSIIKSLFREFKSADTFGRARETSNEYLIFKVSNGLNKQQKELLKDIIT